ncbi:MULTISPECIES: hypothetical protein, partial [unclassified Sphingobium]|uniref:hypothetical protein n=1 Tax=unclassified Sphingobium TaxID=2611147 RepID=UPI0035A57A85
YLQSRRMPQLSHQLGVRINLMSSDSSDQADITEAKPLRPNANLATIKREFCICEQHFVQRQGSRLSGILS